MQHRVLVIGASGRMGREVVRAVTEAGDMVVAGGVARRAAGRDVGEVAGLPPLGIPLDGDLEQALAQRRPTVAVDFTAPGAVLDNIYKVLRHRVPLVVGTTGLTEVELRDVDAACREQGVGAIIAPNFAIGAVLMMRFAADAARHFPHAEIIELHHEKKLDAPSGTALRTAELMMKAWGRLPEAGDESPAGGPARGRAMGGVRIHSVRLPGLVAHQEVILGLPGQVLTLRHDSIDRSSFMPGVLLAIRAARERLGVCHGLEHLLFPNSTA